jgi:hypothetical protein
MIYKIIPIYFCFYLSISYAQKKPDIPKFFCLQDSLYTVKNQRNRASCASFAFITVVEHEIKKISGIEYNLSEQYLTHFLKIGGVKDEAGSIEDCYTVANTIGFVQEEEWPYQNSYFLKGYPCENEILNDTSAPIYCYAHKTPPKYLKNNEIKIEFDARVNEPRNKRNLYKVCENIYKNKEMPIVLFPLIAFYNAELNDGFLHYDPKNNNEGLHYAVIVGYDLEHEYFIVQNSWGNTYGHNGFCFLPFDVFLLEDPILFRTNKFKINSILPEISKTVNTKITDFEVDYTIQDNKSIDFNIMVNIDSLGYKLLKIKAELVKEITINDTKVYQKITLDKEQHKIFKTEFVEQINTFQTDTFCTHVILQSHHLKNFSFSKEMMETPSIQKEINTLNHQLFIRFSILINSDMDDKNNYVTKLLPYRGKE